MGRGLLPIGVAQARLTGDRLRGLPFAFDALLASPLTRARETAQVIAAELGGTARAAPRSRPRRVHAADPARRHHGARASRRTLAACSAQLESPGARLLPRRPPGATATSSWSAHGNVIRGWSPRALGVDSRRWLTMSIGHASLTVLAVEPRARCGSSPSATSATSRPGCRRGAYGNRENWDREPRSLAVSAAARPVVLMISFDGFRWDYPELHGAPTLLALAREGVRAESLVP